MSRSLVGASVLGLALLALLIGGTLGARYVGAGFLPAPRYVWNSDDNCSDVIDTDASQVPNFHKGICSGGIWLYESPIAFSDLEQNRYEQFLLSSDWNNDICVDMLAVKDATLSLLQGDCVDGIDVITTISGDWDQFNYFVTPGDIDGDFLPDLLARRTSDGALIAFYGDGEFGFKNDEGTQIGQGWDVFDMILGPGDFIGHDDCSDVIGRDQSDNTLYVYAGDCAGSFSPGRTAVGGGGDLSEFDWLLAGGNWGYLGLGEDIIGWNQDDYENLHVYRGDGSGNVQPPLQVVNRTDGWQFPFAGDSSRTYVWGDVDCSGILNPIDSLKLLRIDAGLPVEQPPGCRDFGRIIKVGGVNGTNTLWGDVDCTATVDPVDSLKLLIVDAGQPNPPQGLDCPLFKDHYIAAWINQ